jgi:hypothetical protein
MTFTRLLPPAALCLAPLPLAAHETRQMDAHVHGTGALQIAIEGTTVAMEITVPGADIVGFEHAPGSDDERAAIEAALARFDDAFTLFTLQGDAGCAAATKAKHARGYGIAEAHDQVDDHAQDGHDHVDTHDDHGHDHDHAAAAGHDDHDHEENHADFHAIYEMTCTDPAAITAIAFPYFDLFENARQLQVQIVSDSGAMAATVPRTAPTLSLAGAM